ncbi:head-tail connector protein [Parablastomonas sp. CN1-191]|uniref:head-tail connector protein n=1 Tax=Parablastomonas sp. CN1-191 TaxID=3400908 RepID=UPI003BF8C9EE
MQRVLAAPVDVSPAALSELKGWLGITTPATDPALEALLRAGLELCEGFIGQMPLQAECEEVLPAAAAWQALATRPVQAITALEGIAASGQRTALAATAYAVELDADGVGRVLVMDAGEAGRVAVRFTAGIAADWLVLPDALRQGVVRYAANAWSERQSAEAAPALPAAVAALWQPWRRMRLA